MNQDPLRRVQEILHDLVFFLQDNISWEQFLTDCLFAVVSAVILVAFWNKVKQRFLIDSNRVPFVDIDMHNQRIRNIGSESATNILLFHIVDNHDDEHTQIHFMNDIPSLLSGESIEGRLTMDTCFWPEFFLLQYTNAVGMTFWSVVAPSNNRGDPPVIHPPHKPGWFRRPLPSYPSTRNFRYPLWMKRKLKVHPLVDRLKIRWAMKKHGMQ